MLSMILYLASRYFSLPEPNTPVCAHHQSLCVRSPLFFAFFGGFWMPTRRTLIPHWDSLQGSASLHTPLEEPGLALSFPPWETEIKSQQV